MINKSRDEIAYNLIDVESEPSASLLASLAAVEDVINVRLLPQSTPWIEELGVILG